MDAAAVDICPSGQTGAYGLRGPKTWAHVDGVGPFRLRFRQALRIPVEPGDHVVAVWATTWAMPTLGLTHASVHIDPGRTIGLRWTLPTSVLTSAHLVLHPVGQPGGYAPVEPGPIPSHLGPCWVRPPHGSEPLVPVCPNPPFTVGLAAPPLPPVGSARPVGAWYPDPAGRWAHRWWDGDRWTAAVSDGTTTWDDPL